MILELTTTGWNKVDAYTQGIIFSFDVEYGTNIEGQRYSERIVLPLDATQEEKTEATRVVIERLKRTYLDLYEVKLKFIQ